HGLGVARSGPVGGTGVPGGGGEGLARVLTVMREQGRLLVELLGARRLDRTGDGSVDALAPLAELRAVRHLLRQRMLEGVFGLRIERGLVDQLGLGKR